MLTASDLLNLPYTPYLTEGGIAYACRSVAGSSDRLGFSPIGHLRQTVGEVAVELAFRRYLSQQAVPFHVLGMKPFTQPQRYDVLLGGHRCILRSSLIARRKQITQIRRHPGSLLQAHALIPIEQFSSEGHKPDDLYLFAFLLGVVAASQEDVRLAIAASQPAFLIHLLPETWARPVNWIPLNKLVLKSECAFPVKVEIGGQDNERNFITATLELPPRQRMLVEKEFYNLAYIHLQNLPEARIGIHSPARGGPYIIPPHAWQNLWVYGMNILLTGWLTYEEFHRKAKVLNAGTNAFPLERMHERNLYLHISELNPLGQLLERVRRWEAEKRAG